MKQETYSLNSVCNMYLDLCSYWSSARKWLEWNECYWATNTFCNHI